MVNDALGSIEQARAERIKRKVIARGGRDNDGNWWHFPDKPERMRRLTYFRFLEQFEDACQLADAGFLLGVARHFPDSFGDFFERVAQESNRQK